MFPSHVHCQHAAAIVIVMSCGFSSMQTIPYVRVMVSKPLQPTVEHACVSVLVIGRVFLPLIRPSGSCKILALMNGANNLS